MRRPHKPKLTDEQKKRIVTAYERGEADQASLGERFGVTQSHISQLIRKAQEEKIAMMP